MKPEFIACVFAKKRGRNVTRRVHMCVSVSNVSSLLRVYRERTAGGERSGGRAYLAWEDTRNDDWPAVIITAPSTERERKRENHEQNKPMTPTYARAFERTRSSARPDIYGRHRARLLLIITSRRAGALKHSRTSVVYMNVFKNGRANIRLLRL